MPKPWKPGVLLFIFTFTGCSCSTILINRASSGLDKKSIMLTFDDGPYERPDIDSRLLDVLKDRGVKAYFCLIGEKAAKYPETVRRIRSEGHHIVNHSMKHSLLLTHTIEMLRQEIKEFNGTISDILGEDFRSEYLRPPAGLKNENLDRLSEMGEIKILNSTHIPNDPFVNAREWKKYIDELIRSIESDEGGIIVLHNGYEGIFEPDTRDYYDPSHPANREWVAVAVNYLIEKLTYDGYAFVR